ncbi:translation initiation factor IF-2 subunit alpha [Nanoarchaeota archaeon]
MLYQKEGYPEEDEFVLCTITKIQYHSVFCTLDEYEKSGMIHISEVSPGRIRNIRDYVQEGKKVVCKVLRIDLEKQHIDLSLRRVNEAQKKAKLNVIKQEQRAEKIMEQLAEQLKKPAKDIYNETTKALFTNYEMLYLAFEDVVENDADLKKFGLKKEIADPLTALVKEKIMPKQVTISGLIDAVSYAEDGVSAVKKSLLAAEAKGSEITYTGAGKYRIQVTAPDYKQAEKIMADCIKAAESEMKEGELKFER